MDEDTVDKLLSTLSGIDERLSKIEGKKKKKSNSSSESNDAMSSILEKIEALTQAQSSGDSDALNVIYNDALNKALAVSGFKEFLESEDDLGQNRNERLESLPMKDRITAIKKLSSKYIEASGGVRTKETQAVKKAIKKRESLDEKKKEIIEKFRNQGTPSEFNHEIDNYIMSLVNTAVSLQ